MVLDASCPISVVVSGLSNATTIHDWTDWAEHEAHTFSSTILGIILTTASVLLLIAGARLVKVALFLTGFAVLYIASLLLGNSLLNTLSASASASCATLIGVPLILGLVGGALVLKLLTLAFTCLGFAAGGAVGQALYLLLLHRVTTGVIVLGHDLMWLICLLGLAIPGAILMAKYQSDLMILATAAIGSVGLVPGLAMLLLSRIDSRFLWVVNPSTTNPHLSSPFVYGQILAILIYFPIGVLCQRATSAKKEKHEELPYNAFRDGGMRP